MKFIVAMLALAIAVLANSAHAEFKWQHFGADPYATSRAEAMKTRESAFTKLGFPKPVVDLLVKATEQPGQKTRIFVGDRFSAMISKRSVVHQDVVVAFGSPTRGMEYAAPAERWQVVWEDKTYVVVLPDVCNNWSSIITPNPTPTPVASGSCPNERTFMTRSYPQKNIPADLWARAEVLITAAANRDSSAARRPIELDGKNTRSADAYKTDAVSRTLGPELYKLPPAGDSVVFIRLLDPVMLTVAEDLGTIRLASGVAIKALSATQRAYIVETIWPADYKSPAVSDEFRRIWLFPEEWKNCTMVVSAIAP